MARQDGRGGRRGVLAAGTPLPRWSQHSPATARTADHRAALSPATVSALRSRADELSTTLDALALGAYAKVLAALTGDGDVTTGYLPHGAAEPSPCRITVTDGPWTALLARAADAASDAVRHRPAGPVRFDTVFLAGRAAGESPLPEGTVLTVALTERRAADGQDDGLELVLTHRTEAVDEAQAGRIAGYLRGALDTIGRAPETDHTDWQPVSEEEAAFQRDELAGPYRELPDRRFHELFEEQARLRPSDVAAVHGEASLTYDELNRLANRTARALRARGVRDETAVAVVMERTLDWLVAVLAVFKAGGVYLPVEPQLPADRIAYMLARADCALALTERAGAARPAGLEGALRGSAGTAAVALDTLLAEEWPDTDPGVPVAAGQGAYIYFTSGSTGMPKGVLCEHAGFVNHLLAKIDDLGITEGRVVAQTAPQCFDISLWQLVAALAVGGRTLIIGQDAVLDVARFAETVDRERVEVLQVVPSYLEVLLTELDANPRALPALRCVSVTGEALKRELAERWFAAFPDVALVNAYGLTETSDDTNHEVMRRPPQGASVPLGRPIGNVRVYLVDERLRQVPLGAPGEIVFSGVCVGRGYVGDEERTRAAFLPDPYRPGNRLYRSGDFGRWLPDGRLEFSGRRDAQVKIRGFRIEIGEVENRLLEVAGVRDSAVVVVGEGENRQLVAFCTGPASPGDVLAALHETLPDYMVPQRLEHLTALPLTPNGKTDRKALTRIAAETGSPDPGTAPPLTATERDLARLWTEVLKIPADRIGRDTDFFAAGGTSLTMLRLAVALDGLVPPAELKRTPVLADLATLLDRRRTTPPRTDSRKAAE
ncbi:amino acid adenylation domain-containing protein [Streptomyces sp. NPDC001851]|uniref:non-ribosomal peptide synthetase n=1 Tax=Streptomyces sp. NPDC001851 TaxID=3154529 RepID=UPI00332F9D1E